MTNTESNLPGMPFDEALGRFVQTNPKELPAKDVVPYTHNGQVIHLRAADGYINATAMCRASDKEWSNYRQNAGTEAFLNALERSLGIPRDLLVQTIGGGPNDQRGTWVHPQIAINLAMWLSPDFAVRVSEWVVSWMMMSAQRRPPLPDFQSFTEDEKRLYLRDQVASSNKKLAEAARGSGVITPEDFGIFQTYGYQGMYAGRNVNQIKQYKGLPSKAAILDHMGSAELAANLFRITQTEEKLIKEQIPDKRQANKAHFEVGRRVRQAMIEISNIPPENLPVAQDVKKLQRQAAKKQTTIDHKTQFISKEECQQISESHSYLSSPKEVDIKSDLWKYALLTMATRENGEISTSQLLHELPEYIQVPESGKDGLSGRKDAKFSQTVRNLKSHKNSKNNFIFQGYAEDIKSGFRITAKGREFVECYFA